MTGTDYILLRLTLASPWMPSLFAAPTERSMIRPRTNGPRSVIVTTTLLPLLPITRTLLPNGSERCAAVSSRSRNGRPLAVLEPFWFLSRLVRGDALLRGGRCNNSGKYKRARDHNSKHHAALCQVDRHSRKRLRSWPRIITCVSLGIASTC